MWICSILLTIFLLQFSRAQSSEEAFDGFDQETKESSEGRKAFVSRKSSKENGQIQITSSPEGSLRSSEGRKFSSQSSGDHSKPNNHNKSSQLIETISDKPPRNLKRTLGKGEVDLMSVFSVHTDKEKQKTEQSQKSQAGTSAFNEFPANFTEISRERTVKSEERKDKSLKESIEKASGLSRLMEKSTEKPIDSKEVTKSAEVSREQFSKSAKIVEELSGKYIETALNGSTEGLAAKELAAEESTTEGLAVEESTAEELAAEEESTSAESALEELAVEELAAEELAAEESTIEEESTPELSIAEESTAAESTTEEESNPELSTAAESTAAELTTEEESTPELSTPELSTAEESTAEESTAAESTTEEESTPELSIAEESTTEEESIAAELTTEEESTPELSTPELSTPELSTPELSTAEESTAEESAAEEESTPELSTAEESTAAESTTGEESTSELSIAEESTPELSTAEESTAAESTTEESTTEESTANSVAKGTKERKKNESTETVLNQSTHKPTTDDDDLLIPFNSLTRRDNKEVLSFDEKNFKSNAPGIDLTRTYPHLTTDNSLRQLLTTRLVEGFGSYKSFYDDPTTVKIESTSTLATTKTTTVLTPEKFLDIKENLIDQSESSESLKESDSTSVQTMTEMSSKSEPDRIMTRVGTTSKMEVESTAELDEVEGTTTEVDFSFNNDSDNGSDNGRDNGSDLGFKEITPITTSTTEVEWTKRELEEVTTTVDNGAREKTSTTTVGSMTTEPEEAKERETAKETTVDVEEVKETNPTTVLTTTVESTTNEPASITEETTVDVEELKETNPTTVDVEVKETTLTTVLTITVETTSEPEPEPKPKVFKITDEVKETTLSEDQSEKINLINGINLTENDQSAVKTESFSHPESHESFQNEKTIENEVTTTENLMNFAEIQKIYKESMAKDRSSSNKAKNPVVRKDLGKQKISASLGNAFGLLWATAEPGEKKIEQKTAFDEIFVQPLEKFQELSAKVEKSTEKLKKRLDKYILALKKVQKNSESDESEEPLVEEQLKNARNSRRRSKDYLRRYIHVKVVDLSDESSTKMRDSNRFRHVNLIFLQRLLKRS